MTFDQIPAFSENVPFKILRQAGFNEALQLIKQAGREYARHQTSQKN
jgi:hypothetical protein